MRVIANYLWRLLPGNPILLRSVGVAGRRWRDLVVRCVYLGVLIGVVFLALISDGGGASGVSLDDLSRTSGRIFRDLSYVQLALVALLAPVFAAGAITQQRDPATYDVLLSTPLTNAQIVLGTLAGRTFFVAALLLGGVPVFSITQIFGGVTLGEIVRSVTLAAATAAATGAAAIAVATFRLGGRRTVFGFYFAIVLVLVAPLLLDDVPRLAMTDADGTPLTTSVFTPFNPFLALRTVLDPTLHAPPTAAPPGWGVWPLSWAATRPVSFHVSFLLATSVLLILPSIFMLRRLAFAGGRMGTFSPRAMLARRFPGVAVARAPRRVGNNPIAWREQTSRAAGLMPRLFRYGSLLIGVGVTIAGLVLHNQDAGAPDRMTRVGGYNPGVATLFVENDAVYRLADDLRVRLEGRDVPRDTLARALAVTDVQTEYRGDELFATRVDLAERPRRLSTDGFRRIVLLLTLLQTAGTILVVTNAASNTVTAEREDGTLDLLLTTPMTSRYYVRGKLRGLVTFALPLLAMPLLVLVLVIAYDLLRGEAGTIVRPEALIVVPPTLVVVTAFAAMAGMGLSLRSHSTVKAGMLSLVLVLGVLGSLAWVGWQILRDQINPVTLAFASFSPATTLWLMLRPDLVAAASGPAESRVVLTIVPLLAAAVYAGGVTFLYRKTVWSFDLVVRRLTR